MISNLYKTIGKKKYLCLVKKKKVFQFYKRDDSTYLYI